AAMTATPRSSAPEKSLSGPSRRPIGVRDAPTMTEPDPLSLQAFAVVPVADLTAVGYCAVAAVTYSAVHEPRHAARAQSGDRRGPRGDRGAGSGRRDRVLPEQLRLGGHAHRGQ